jgi:GAF domain-containing protein
MLTRGHRLRVGSQGLVGSVTQMGYARIALDVGNDATFFSNPDLPATRSEIALPLSIGKTIIGALDVQSEFANAFSEEDIDVLGTLANQVAITIQNTQLITTTQKALMEVQRTIRQYVRQQWGSQQFREQIVGKIYTDDSVQPIEAEIQSPEISRALSVGKIEKSAEAIAIPIKLRGETIGLLGVQTSEDEREWSEDEIVMMQSAAERVALSIENSRLLSSSQRQAAKERVIGDISARISTSVDIDQILETAAQELGQAISGSEVIIQFKGKA